MTQVAAHPRDNLVAGGYEDGTVRIGRIDNENAVIARPGGGAAARALAWSPDGGTLVAGTAGGKEEAESLRV